MPISAVEAFAPALELTKQRMFRPARFSVWWRIAVIGALSGEFSGGSVNFNIPANTQHQNNHLLAMHEQLGAIVGVIALALLVGILVMLALMYIASVFRFQLFDATLTGRYRIREGWSFWRQRAVPYFRLQIWILVVSLAGIAALCGIPLGYIYSLTGGFKHWNNAAILPIIIGVLVLIAWGIAVGVFSVFTKDFIVPMMALEGLGYAEAWHRLRAMIESEKKSYALYILMKIVVAIGGGILFALLMIAVLLIVGIPTGIIAFVVYLTFGAAVKSGAGLVLGITALVLIVLFALLTVFVLAAPLPIFYTAFGIFFFAHRYLPLWNAMFPPAPPLPEAPPAPPAGPEPAPAL